MKQLIWKLILPLTLISFATITKWWYAFPTDAPDTFYSGFPFPFIGDGWHTSMSFQIFILEFFADLVIYFLFWTTIVFFINRYLAELKIHRFLVVGLYIISGLIICGAAFVTSISESIFRIKRPYEMEIVKTGYKFYWQQIERSDNLDHHPEF